MARSMQLLGGRVEARGGFVEDDQAGIAQEDAREGQQLGLAGGDAAPARLQLGVQPVGQPCQPVGQSQFVDHRQDLVVGDAAVEESEVVAHGGLEELDVLGDQATRCRSGLSWCWVQRDAPQPDLAVGWVVQAEDQPRQGGLAAEPVRPSRPITVPGFRSKSSSSRTASPSL